VCYSSSSYYYCCCCCYGCSRRLVKLPLLRKLPTCCYYGCSRRLVKLPLLRKLPTCCYYGCSRRLTPLSLPLKLDAERDLFDLGFDKEALPVASLHKFSYDAIKHDGVLFATYSSIASKQMKGTQRTRLDQIIKWCGGAKFNGLIMFDESHKAKNLIASGKAGKAVSRVVALPPSPVARTNPPSPPLPSPRPSPAKPSRTFKTGSRTRASSTAPPPACPRSATWPT